MENEGGLSAFLILIGIWILEPWNLPRRGPLPRRKSVAVSPLAYSDRAARSSVRRYAGANIRSDPWGAQLVILTVFSGAKVGGRK